MSAFYNEIDEAACAVLRALIRDGVIAPGMVEPQSIKDLQPADLVGFEQHHFFAGGGLWSVAARMAGWSDDRALWTASCPCQPFSAAGNGAGRDDPRHLWPDLFRLVRACRPPVLVGEQVASAAGLDWFDGVAADLAGEGYACRAVDIPAAAVDAPHRRQRLYWVALADSAGERRGERREPEHTGLEGASRPVLVGRDADGGEQRTGALADTDRVVGRLGNEQRAGRLGNEQRAGQQPQHEQNAGTAFRAESGNAEHALADADADRGGRGGRAEDAQRRALGRAAAERAADGAVGDAERARLEGHAGDDGAARGWPLAHRSTAAADGRRMGDAASLGWREGRPEYELRRGRDAVADADVRARRNGSFWSDAEWLVCHDGKARRSKPGLRLLVDGFPGRVDLWRVAGNAIVPQLAAEVLGALLDTLDDINAPDDRSLLVSDLSEMQIDLFS